MHDIAYATIPTSTITSTTPQGDGSYTDDGWLEALTTFQDWADKGYFTDGANGIDFENHWADFCSGRAAMLTQGTWLFKTIDDCAAASEGALDWANVPFPVRDGMPFQSYVGIGSGWYLPASVEDDPERMDAVLDLVDAFITPDTADAWVSKAQIFPAVPFDDTKVDLTPAQEGALSIIQQAGDNGGAVPVGFNNSSEESEIWAAGLQGIVDGSLTPRELIEQLQSQLEETRSDWSS
jgi:raffinose/stachyose/melibiose transport system substrate-binding protein